MHVDIIGKGKYYKDAR